MKKENIMLQTIILIILVSIAGFLGLQMPIVALAYPIIVTFIGLKNGIAKSSTAFIISLLVIAAMTQSLNSLIIPLQYGILSIFTVFLINKKYKANKIILYTASLVFGMVLIHMGLKWYFTGINTFVELEESLIEITRIQIATLRDGVMSESEVSQISNLLRSMADYIASVVPALLIISSASIAYINYYISVRLARKSGEVVMEIPEFSRIIFPTHVIIGSGTVLVLSYALKYVGNFNYIQLIDNIFVLLFVVFLLEGLSLTVFIINKMKVGKVLKVIFITVIVLSSFLNIVLFSLGIIDIILDFRKLRRVEQV